MRIGDVGEIDMEEIEARSSKHEARSEPTASSV